LVRCGIGIESVPTEPIFENVLIFEKKGAVLTLRKPVGFVLTHTVDQVDFDLLNLEPNLEEVHVLI
jgi:hypothetical protein